MCKKVLLFGSLGVVGIIVLVVIIALVSGSDEVTDETVPTLTVSVTEIYEAYEENEARANVTYKEQPLNLQFRVDEIEDKYVVQNLDEYGFVTAQLSFDESELVEFDVGDQASRVCYLKGLQLDLWLEFDCR